jgi:hypothetical protein
MGSRNHLTSQQRYNRYHGEAETATERIRAFLKEEDAKGYASSSSKSSTATPVAYYDHSLCDFCSVYKKVERFN